MIYHCALFVAIKQQKMHGTSITINVVTEINTMLVLSVITSILYENTKQNLTLKKITTFARCICKLLLANFDVAQCALQQVIATKSQTSPHFPSQPNLCPIISFHNSLSNFYRFHTSCQTIYLTHTICCYQQFEH